jgi:pSer/pThr/pTyr-binding forkhead associated (FHA) protein
MLPDGSARNIEKHLRIGRHAGADVVLDDTSVSEAHARILLDDDGTVLVVDDGSSNGTRWGGRKLKPGEPRAVPFDSDIILGRVLLSVRYQEGTLPSMPTAQLAMAMVDQLVDAMRVVVVEGPDRGKSFPVPKLRKYIVGRDPEVDILLSDAAVSTVHAEIDHRAGGVYVRDMGSKHGTEIGVADRVGNKWEPWDGVLVVALGNTCLALDDPERRVLRTAPSELKSKKESPRDEPPVEPPPAPPAAGGPIAFAPTDVPEAPKMRKPLLRTEHIVYAVVALVLVLTVVALFVILFGK